MRRPMVHCKVEEDYHFGEEGLLPYDDETHSVKGDNNARRDGSAKVRQEHEVASNFQCNG